MQAKYIRGVVYIFILHAETLGVYYMLRVHHSNSATLSHAVTSFSGRCCWVAVVILSKPLSVNCSAHNGESLIVYACAAVTVTECIWQCMTTIHSDHFTRLRKCQAILQLSAFQRGAVTHHAQLSLENSNCATIVHTWQPSWLKLESWK